MENGLKDIKELFSGLSIFNIPKYQRAYAWTKRQWDDFMGDIENHNIENKYFLGTILLQKNNATESDFEIIDVVDGQQRITTCIIFMKVLIEQLRRKTKEKTKVLEDTYIEYDEEYRLRVIESDNDFFKSYILGNKEGKEYIRTPSQRRLHQVKKYFEEKLSVLPSETLIEYKNKLHKNTQVLTYAVGSPTEATLIFETTNDRGKSLTNLEKIKSFLMYKCFQTEKKNPDNLLIDIQSRFSEIYREFEKISEQMDEDTVLRYHYIAFEPWKEKGDYQNVVRSLKERLNKIIKQNKPAKAVQLINDFSLSLKESYMNMVALMEENNSVVRDLFVLDRMGNIFPLLLKAFRMDAENNYKDFYKIARLLEIYSFRVYAAGQRRGFTGQSQLYILARDFKGDYTALATELKTLISKYSWNGRLREDLSSPYLYEEMTSGDLRYLFWKYENYLRQTQQPKWAKMGEKEIQTKSKKYQFTIEHIAPQNPKETKVIANKKAYPRMTAKFQEEFLHKLGNLTIDPQSANSSKGRKEFKVKNSKYFIKAPLKIQNELEDFLPKKNKWNSDAIQNRTDNIIEFTILHWDPEKVKIKEEVSK